MSDHPSRVALVVATGVFAFSLAGCIGETYTRGYVISDLALEQVPEGSSREQVLLALGTPSATAEFGSEVFYYISQTAKRTARYQQLTVVDQQVLAVYFNPDEEVNRIARYGIEDGRVFDYVSRTTPTTGKDVSFVNQLLTAATASPATGQ